MTKCGVFLYSSLFFNLDLTFGKKFMNFKLSLVYTALFAGVSVSVLAETQHKASTETIEQINVQDTGIKQNGYQTTGTSVV